mgnify:CR=1 FL=1
MKRYGLIGKTLKHSFSQQYFSQKFAQLGLSHTHSYQNFELPAIAAIAAVLSSGVAGLNVTIPYKESVLGYLDAVTDTVKAVGACNCIQFQNGRAVGHNTDVVGFSQSLQPLLEPQHQQALVLGTGGAAKSVQYVLQQLGIDCKTVSHSGKGVMAYADVTTDVIGNHLLLVNTTPLGMHPHTDACPDIDYNAITPQHLLYDLVYNPAETLFLRRGKEAGAIIKNGYEMLVLQAEESWRIWNE